MALRIAHSCLRSHDHRRMMTYPVSHLHGHAPLFVLLQIVCRMGKRGKKAAYLSWPGNESSMKTRILNGRVRIVAGEHAGRDVMARVHAVVLEHGQLEKIDPFPDQHPLLARRLFLRYDHRFDSVVVSAPAPFYSHIFKGGVNSVCQFSPVPQDIDGARKGRSVATCRLNVVKDDEGKLIERL